MSLFESEAKMQDWLSKVLDESDGLVSILDNINFISKYEAKNAAEKRILQATKVCLESINITQKIFENENISLGDGEVLKPDFVLYSPEEESVIILELKNLGGPTRQAGTELSAYSCEIRTAIPFLCDGDVVHVLISTEWPTLLRHYVRHEIFWQHKNVLCLQPFSAEDGVKLRILLPDELAEDVASFEISPRYLGGYQICLYDMELYTENRNRARLDKYIEQFKAALTAMATIGNRMNGHGFAFLWRDKWQQSIAPYSITVLNFAPFQSIERFLHLDSELPKVIRKFIELVREDSPQGHGASLNSITDACIEMVDNVCNPIPEAYMDWGALREIMSERAEQIAFVAWGRFGEAYIKNLQDEYQSGNLSCSSMDPIIGIKTVMEIVDDKYEFIDLCYIDSLPY